MGLSAGVTYPGQVPNWPQLLEGSGNQWVQGSMRWPGTRKIERTSKPRTPMPIGQVNKLDDCGACAHRGGLRGNHLGGRRRVGAEQRRARRLPSGLWLNGQGGRRRDGAAARGCRGSRAASAARLAGAKVGTLVGHWAAPLGSWPAVSSAARVGGLRLVTWIGGTIGSGAAPCGRSTSVATR